MPVSDVPSKSKSISFLPFWVRTGMACVMFAVTAISMWKGFLRFEWVPYFCFGLYYLLYVQRQKAEALGTYFNRPRTIVSVALLVAAVAGFGHNFYAAFAK